MPQAKSTPAPKKELTPQEAANACVQEIEKVLDKYGFALTARVNLVMQDNGTYAIAASPMIQPRPQPQEQILA